MCVFDWHRRQALAFAATLPDNVNDAKIVLGLVNELLDGFLLVGHSGEECSPVLRPHPGDA